MLSQVFFPNLHLSFGLCEFILSLPFRLLAFFILKVGSFFPFLLPAVVLFPTLISVVVHLLLSFMLFGFFLLPPDFFFGSFLFDFWIVLVQWAFFSHCAAPLLLSPFKVPWFVCLFFPYPSAVSCCLHTGSSCEK